MITETVQLRASDGHRLEAYQATPDHPRAGLVVLQEIFGVNAHIKRMVDEYAEAGFKAIAPAMFDRIRPGIEVGYDDVETGRGFAGQLDADDVVRDMAAAVEQVRTEGKVAVVGYCWGGSAAYLAACHTPVQAAVCYYGTRILQYLDRSPQCPVMYHFGEADASIPPDKIETIRNARPEGVFHVYPGAEHGFNCNERASYDAASAALAFQRTREFLDSTLQL